MTTAEIKLPPKLIPVFAPARGELRYRGAYGGRGSAKSFSFAKMAAVYGYAEPLRILCAREIQDSIKDSFHAEVKNAIASEPWLADAYDVGVDYIKGKNGTEFLFKGLRHTVNTLKSMAQIDLCIVEEAEDVPEASWLALEPTIRAPKSEIWVIWNPKVDGSPVDSRFVKSAPERSAIVEMNYTDNPWFPMELEELRKRDQRRLDPDTYAHVWEGQYLRNGEAAIFRGKWVVDEFTPTEDWNGPYFGADFGFSVDPSTLIKMWIADSVLYIEYEAHGVGVELDEMPQFYESIPESRKHAIRADSARPETISHLSRRGFLMESVKKWQGSVEDGIEHIRGAYDKVVIHPRCKHTAEEFRLYSYKKDRMTGDVLPIVVDAHNHCIDAIRYGLNPLIQNGGANWYGLV